jgi:hypothetical protein
MGARAQIADTNAIILPGETKSKKTGKVCYKMGL